MVEKGTYTYQEIKSQPEIFPDVLAHFRQTRADLTNLWNNGAYDQVIFTGCGSTYHISKSAAALFQSLTGVPSFFFPGSEVALFPEVVFPKGKRTLLVTESRSGETTETIEAVSVFREKASGNVLAITCDSQSTLAQHADIVLAADAAQEKSVAQTRSFSSMLLLTEAFAGLIGGQDISLLDKIPGAVDRLFNEYEGLAQELGQDLTIDANFFLGSGLLYGVASEAMLKLKEMSLSVSEAFHVLDFRHGPMSMVNETAIIIGLLSETAFRQEVAVMKDMHALGGKILSLTAKPSGELAGLGSLVLLDNGLPAWANTVTYLPFLQLYAFYRSIAKGLNPDSPTNLEAVIILDK